MATKKESADGAVEKKAPKKAAATKATGKTPAKAKPKAAAKPAVAKKAVKKPVAKKTAEKKPAAKPAAAEDSAETTAKVEAPPETKPAAPKSKAKAAPKAAKPASPYPGRSKKYIAAASLLEREKLYPVDEAVTLVKQTSTTKFDATIEMHLKLGVDPRKAEQNIRGTVKLPAGTGKTLKVLAFVPEAQAAATKKAGADYVADDALKKKIADGWAEFDVSVATPDQMSEVAKLGKVLGPKGLMPNPKAGTVTAKPADAIAEVKKGTIEYRLAKDSTIHAGVGKASFSASDLSANLKAYYQAILSDKPSDLKGTYIKSVTIAATMGPGIKLHAESLQG